MRRYPWVVIVAVVAVIVLGCRQAAAQEIKGSKSGYAIDIIDKDYEYKLEIKEHTVYFTPTSVSTNSDRVCSIIGGDTYVVISSAGAMFFVDGKPVYACNEYYLEKLK